MFVRYSKIFASVLTITALIGGQSITPAQAAGSYTMTYNGNGNTSGTAPIDPLSPYNPNVTVTVLGNTNGLAKTGYTFTGWNTSADGSGTDYAPGSTFSIKNSIILFAKWSINSYTVTYDGNGNTGGAPPSAVTQNYNTTFLVSGAGTLTRTGYTFAGWNTAANGSGAAYLAGATFTVTGNVTLYALWTINTFTLSFNGNGNTGGSAPASVTQNYNSTYTLPGAGTLTRTGYTFAGWNTASNGSGTSYSPGSTYTITGNATLFARWDINTFTLTYSAGVGGSISGSASQTVNYGGSGTSVTAVPNAGYNFVAWSDGVLTATRSDANVMADLSVTASFGINAFALTYAAEANGTVTGSLSQTVEYGDSGTSVTAVPNAGYRFVSWSDGVLTATRTDTNVMANLSVTATFAINSYALDYSAGANGSISGSALQTVNYGGSGTSVTAVPNAGYRFVSWSDGLLTATRTDNNVNADLSVTASFAINSYTLSYTAGANGSVTDSLTQTVNYGDSGTSVTAVPNAGYNFVSWSDGVLTPTRTDAHVTGNLSVTALFAINGFVLSYSAGANGSVIGSLTQAVEYGDSGSSVTAVPNAGYNFVSWSDGVLTPTRTDSNVIANLSVTAGFAINSYTLTYLAGANGSISGSTSQTVSYGGDGTSVTAVASDGYNFVAWSDGVLTATRTDTNISSDLNVSASFLAESTYRILYFDNVESETIAVPTDQTNYLAGESASISSVQPTRVGYDFVSWNTSPDATGVAVQPSSVLQVSENITLFAQWSVKSYVVSYDGNGSTAGTVPASQNRNYNSSVTISGANTLTRSGYTFVRWNSAPNGSGSSYSPGTSVLVTSNLTLYAQWNITNNSGGSSNGGSSGSNGTGGSSGNSGSDGSNNQVDTNVVTTTTVDSQSSADTSPTNQRPDSSNVSAPRPLFLTSTGSNMVQLNKTTRLTLSEKVGGAVVTYSTLTPNKCSVTPDGVVTGLNGGTCSILASISGSDRYPVTTPTVIVLTVQKGTSNVLTAAKDFSSKTTKRIMTVARSNGAFIIKLSLGSRFANKKVTLQIGLKNSGGKLKYRNIASLLLNSKGNGSVTRKATFAKNLYLRALASKKVVLTKKIV